MNLYASGEDYLEAILVLYKKFGSVRSVDIARHMEVSKPSVCHAVNILKEGFLTIDENHFLYLTSQGKVVAEKKYDISEFQTFINGVKKDLTAVKNGIIYSYNNGLQKVV